ncbi:MAG: hypothetical protein U5K31_14125 [Balneolaceae bacterium]|nr:hypothetical protein [Balneolaceae bacterium]
MDLATPEDTFKNITFQGAGFGELAEHLSALPDDESHLSLFLGLYQPDKKRALEELGRAAGKSVETVDFEELVSRSESETYEALDRIFEQHRNTGALLYFRNGDQLCGVYTGYTHSKVKYASPQERYFLQKAKEHKGPVVVDISEFSAADKTIRRAAGSIVRFTLPDSPVKRFLWHLRNYTLHGFELRSKRPDAYADTAENY